jgi:uncharacterized membrane protein YidH (DUF202 family)
MNNPQEYLANERTFLAWLRTCIAVIGLGPCTIVPLLSTELIHKESDES